MRWALLALTFFGLGCTSAPDVVWLGELESPCSTNDDCVDRPCVQIDGFRSCTQWCSEGSGCPRSYGCSVSVGACLPSRATGSCRGLHERCGPSYPDCCRGTACAVFDDWGARCVELGCTVGNVWDCTAGFCCVAAGEGNTACVPPTHCPD